MDRGKNEMEDSLEQSINNFKIPKKCVELCWQYFKRILYEIMKGKGYGEKNAHNRMMLQKWGLEKDTV